MALERRLGRQDSLLAALDVLLIGHRETAVSVEGNGIFLRHMYTALRLDLPVLPAPDQRDRIDLLIVLDMFQGRERLVELGHIGVGDIVDVAKPVVPDFLRIADDVVFIVLAEQAVGLRMLLRTIYIALDQNSHFKLFQLVSRRGFGRGHFMRGFDPRVRCRFHPRLTIFIIGEVERDGRRGLGVLYLPDQIAGLLHEPCRPDSHWADISARAIAYDLADRMLCVGRESERILYHIMRSGCRNADNIYNNAGHVVFRGLGGLVGGGRVRLPDGVEIGGRGGCCNRIARLDGGLCCVRIPSPAEEGVVVSFRLIAGNGERHRAGTALQRHRFGVRHVGDGIRRVLVVGQGVLGLFFFTGYGDGEGRGFLPPIVVSFILDQASTSVAITNFASMVIVIIECQLHCRCAGLCRSKVERQARKVLIFVIAIPAGNGPAEILQDSRVAELDCRRACRIVVGNKFG